MVLAGSAERDAAAAAFFEGPVRTWEIVVEPDGLAGLRESPRDYAPATVRIDGKAFRRVGIHVKGSAGSKRGVDDRPALTLKFNRFVRGQRAFGIEKLHLNNAVQDPSLLHENLASRLYRAAGIPVTRASHALLRFNGRDLGVYVVKEAYDEDYLRRNFPGESPAPGNLYEGAFAGDIDRALERDAGHGPADRSDLAALRAALRVPPAQRWAALSQVLDTERFLTMAAIQLAIDDWDGYVRNRNNYRVHFRSTDGRALFLPHGMDQLLVHAEAPVRDAWVGLVAGALLELPEQRIRLRDRMRELGDGLLSERWMTNELARIESRVATALAGRSDEDRARLLPDRWGESQRIRQRLGVVRRELASWPDPLPSWPKGRSIQPGGWSVLVQGGHALVDTNAVAPDNRRSLHFVVDQPATRASLRTVVTLPAGEYRLAARARVRGLEPMEDEFGRGVSVRTTGSTATAHLEGDREWTEVSFDVSQPEDGPAEMILDVRANRGEVWFDAASVRVEAR